MKKLLYLLLLLPLGLFSSCDDDNDMPDVTMNVSMSNVVQYDGITYVVAGDTIKVNSVTVKPVTGGNAAIAGGVTYIWDVYTNEMSVGYSPVAPYGIDVPTATVGVGNHLLDLRMAIVQVDKSVANAFISYPIKVVASADDIPDPAPEKGTYTASATAHTTK